MQTIEQLTMEATIDNLPQAVGLVERMLEGINVPMKDSVMMAIVTEELFVNIANYAYKPHTGLVTITAETNTDPKQIRLILKDRGIPFNPLERPDPDVTLSAEDRKVGGLGIFFSKSKTDDMQYRYEDGQNILTITKYFD